MNVELGELDSLIETKCEELEVKEKQHALIQMSIKEKEVELGLIQKSISEGGFGEIGFIGKESKTEIRRG